MRELPLHHYRVMMSATQTAHHLQLTKQSMTDHHRILRAFGSRNCDSWMGLLLTPEPASPPSWAAAGTSESSLSHRGSSWYMTPRLFRLASGQCPLRLQHRLAPRGPPQQLAGLKFQSSSQEYFRSSAFHCSLRCRRRWSSQPECTDFNSSQVLGAEYRFHCQLWPYRS